MRNKSMFENWTELIIGFWIMVSPWLFGFSDISIMKWSNVICGLILVLINAWMLFGKEPITAGEDARKNN
jgi:hypothetical protein